MSALLAMGSSNLQSLFHRLRHRSVEYAVSMKQSEESCYKENPLFKAVKQNDMEMLEVLLAAKDVDPLITGPDGETLLHVALLFRHRTLALRLLDAVPAIINIPMTCELYRGETAIHIAIANENVVMVKELLHRGADITARACGSFFLPGKRCQCYYGEYTLSFAACTGNEMIVKLLMDHGASLITQDSLGNTVLHVLVLHPDRVLAVHMYDFLISLVHEGQRRSLEAIRNAQGFSPLKLAAAEGNLAMFNHLMQKRKNIYWNCGPVRSAIYDLTDIDTWGDKNSILEIITSSKNKEARNLIGMTPIKELLHHKWKVYGFKYFIIWTVLYIFYILIFTVCCIMRPLQHVNRLDNATIMGSKQIRDSYESDWDYVRLMGEIITVLGAITIFIMEILYLMKNGPKKYFGNTVTGGPFHAIMMSYGVLVLVIVVLRVLTNDVEVIFMSIALILGWCNIMYFARGFSMLGPFTIMIQKMLFGDLLRFIMFLIIVLLGFSAAFHVAFDSLDSNIFIYFRNYPTTLFTLSQLMMGLKDLPIPNNMNLPAIIIVLYLAYMMFAYLLLLNLLIAMMGDTHFRVANERVELWKAQIAATTVLLESRVPRWLWMRSGIPGRELGLDGDRWYIRIEERKEMSPKRNCARDDDDGGRGESPAKRKMSSTTKNWNIVHKNFANKFSQLHKMQNQPTVAKHSGSMD
ncbi:transient receptor potential cation channel subfamily V member 5-like isoform X2 [Petromyzon marinus]|uniref:transient receptor potential cation channel subfamily V member 5-like isoform X2 n=1 Tax=Petromyzon marinus TaxID=7757 RepID=UPI003F6FAA23